MEILIKIPDEAYEAYKHWEKNGVATVEQSLIVHGKPLPKGHGRLIDENHVIAELVYRKKLLADDVTCGQVTEIFNSAVVIEADKESKNGNT